MWNRPLENALKDAIDKRDVARIKTLAKMIDDESNRTDDQANKEGLLSLNADGQSFLLYALARRNIDAFRTLYPYYRHNSTLLQLRDKKGRSLFWYAVALNEETIAKELFACNFNKPKKARENLAAV